MAVPVPYIIIWLEWERGNFWKRRDIFFWSDNVQYTKYHQNSFNMPLHLTLPFHAYSCSHCPCFYHLILGLPWHLPISSCLYSLLSWTNPILHLIIYCLECHFEHITFLLKSLQDFGGPQSCHSAIVIGLLQFLSSTSLLLKISSSFKYIMFISISSLP